MIVYNDFSFYGMGWRNLRCSCACRIRHRSLDRLLSLFDIPFISIYTSHLDYCWELWFVFDAFLVFFLFGKFNFSVRNHKLLQAVEAAIYWKLWIKTNRKLKFQNVNCNNSWTRVQFLLGLIHNISPKVLS